MFLVYTKIYFVTLSEGRSIIFIKKTSAGMEQNVSGIHRNFDTDNR